MFNAVHILKAGKSLAPHLVLIKMCCNIHHTSEFHPTFVSSLTKTSKKMTLILNYLQPFTAI